MLELAPDALAELAREGDAVLHRRALERDEGDDVGGAHARMLARVRVEVDAAAAPRGCRRTPRRRRRRSSATKVMTVRLWLASEQTSRRCTPATRGDRVADRRDDLGRRPSEKFGTHSMSFMRRAERVEEPGVHRRSCRRRATVSATGQGCALQRGDDAARLANEERAGGDVPRGEAELPEGLEAAAGDVGEVERGRAGSGGCPRSRA